MSDMERQRALIEQTVNEFLMDLADPKPRTEPAPGAAGSFTGVVFPEVGAPSPGSVMKPDAARKLGAQLIRAADLHDAIYERGVEVGQMLPSRRVRSPGPCECGDGGDFPGLDREPPNWEDPGLCRKCGGYMEQK